MWIWNLEIWKSENLKIWKSENLKYQKSKYWFFQESEYLFRISFENFTHIFESKFGSPKFFSSKSVKWTWKTTRTYWILIKIKENLGLRPRFSFIFLWMINGYLPLNDWVVVCSLCFELLYLRETQISERLHI